MARVYLFDASFMRLAHTTDQAVGNAVGDVTGTLGDVTSGLLGPASH